MPRKYSHQIKIRLNRGDERRHETQSQLPFLTEEGLVLVDRRTVSDRRTGCSSRKSLRMAA